MVRGEIGVEREKVEGERGCMKTIERVTMKGDDATTDVKLQRARAQLCKIDTDYSSRGPQLLSTATCSPMTGPGRLRCWIR